jgi:dihydropteroate synthase
MFTLNCKGRLLVIEHPIVMGILNVTPDSFYPGSRVTEKDIVVRAERMLQEGATILDIGGQSTRPGSEQVAVTEELERVIPAIQSISSVFPNAVISVDTYHSDVAAEAVNAGASIVNDVSGGTLDSAMITTVAELKVPYICMHMKGTPATMQQYAEYSDVTRDVLDYFIAKTDECKKAGINDIIIDPGFGFAKNIEQNFRLLKQLSVLKILGKPILAGLSRKATVYKTLETTADKALNGTTVVHTMALINGASILRVHDVKEAAEAIKLYTAYAGA